MGNAYRIFAAAKAANKAAKNAEKMQKLLNDVLLLLEEKQNSLSFYRLERDRIIRGLDIYSDPMIQNASLEAINENIEKTRGDIIQTMGVIRFIRERYDQTLVV